nr:hypothetical protein [Tanacetum cinerariifolium]
MEEYYIRKEDIWYDYKEANVTNTLHHMRRYFDGHVDIFDMADIDLFSVVALNMMVVQLGYTGKLLKDLIDELGKRTLKKSRVLSLSDRRTYTMLDWGCFGLEHSGGLAGNFILPYIVEHQCHELKEVNRHEVLGYIGVGPMGNFKEVKVDTDNETKEESTESDIKENDTSGSALKDLDYDPKHDEVFDNDEHILEDTLVSMNNFHFNPDPKHDLSTVVVEVHKDDIDVIDYDSFGSHLNDRVNSERRTQLRELRRIGKITTRVPIKTTST